MDISSKNHHLRTFRNVNRFMQLNSKHLRNFDFFNEFRIDIRYAIYRYTIYAIYAIRNLTVSFDIATYFIFDAAVSPSRIPGFIVWPILCMFLVLAIIKKLSKMHWPKFLSHFDNLLRYPTSFFKLACLELKKVHNLSALVRCCFNWWGFLETLGRVLTFSFSVRQ